MPHIKSLSDPFNTKNSYDSPHSKRTTRAICALKSKSATLQFRLHRKNQEFIMPQQRPIDSFVRKSIQLKMAIDWADLLLFNK